jgi:hypothetical protein
MKVFSNKAIFLECCYTHGIFWYNIYMTLQINQSFLRHCCDSRSYRNQTPKIVCEVVPFVLSLNGIILMHHIVPV